MLATVSYIAAAQHSRFRPSPSGHMKRLVHTASSCAIALALFFGSQSPDSTGPFTFGGDLAKAAPGGKGGGGGQGGGGGGKGGGGGGSGGGGGGSGGGGGGWIG